MEKENSIQPHKNGKREKRKEEKEFDGGKDNWFIILEDLNNLHTK